MNNGGVGSGGDGGRQLQATPTVFFFIASVFIAFLLAPRPCSALTSPVLDPKEVTALQQIARTLGKTDWNFSVDPCSWFPPAASNPSVGCECPQNSTTYCHVISIFLRQLGLAGTLPKELTELPFLTQFDVTDNYLSGTIPTEWGALRLVNLTLYGNRLSGPIPAQLGDMVTLQQLTLEANQFSGEIPPHIGNLSNLQRLVLSSNNFTGELPQTLAKLTNMTDFRISGTGLSGQLPDFIVIWTQQERLEIQGKNLVGPIPDGISKLENLEQLRISDILGTSSKFPDLSRQTRLSRLILRNCLLFGQIPDYIGQFKALRILDLSFNNLTGGIPNSLQFLSRLQFVYLTNNSLSGTVPGWILGTSVEVDLSYNNFTDITSDSSLNCMGGKTNLVESFPEVLKNEHIIHPCLRKNYPCNARKPRHSSFHVKCGSSQSVTVGNTTFDGDTAIDGGAAFYASPQGNWALSSTGTIMDNNDDSDVYTVSINSTLSMSNPELYRTARISPLSLKYYGLCLWNGPYTVKLYFSEIVITDDKNYTSLGTRIFDVYIQGKLELKDFNIKKAANGSNKATVQIFQSVNVTDNILEIHFFWAGKGTTGIPYIGVYGPLVSAISVEPEFNPPKEGIDRKIIISIVASLMSLLLLIFLVIGLLWKKGILFHKQDEIELRQFNLQAGSFTLKQIKAATNNFDDANKIGEGGFGSVYKGHLSDGTIIAVKQLSSQSKQGSHEFITELGMISALQHPNLVKLYGCCTEGKQLLLVYEYMENNSLATALFGPEEKRLKLNWPTRHKICIGIARGLAYLHEESTLKIVHRDIKSTNILLDKDLNAKISDFGLAKLHEDEKSHISTRIAGTYGYMAPEYAMRGHLSYKADVYSFGVVTLEIVSGQNNVSCKNLGEGAYLLDWACILQQRGNLLDLVDSDLDSTYSKEEALTMLNVALLCTNPSHLHRPKMSTVVSMLEGREPVQAPLPSPAVSTTDLSTRMQRVADWQCSNQVQASSHSTEMSWTGSYVSGPAQDESEHILPECLDEIRPSA
ncbi:probable LRR receptor-like serine/threonine-protein kinase At1g07650 isoform X7 [Nymphaea colorata]|uniref:probable LRR receptor-like serine/threonine-protein kinase At1g07650 isoform X7 n=1 Tax=Nymphaea colorata TaxID=210225 RepID=UPI00214EC56F|nr:probable LRR receptor-like serine/threonine-protein kinase At1g07650 isoform X7 [Nymphaea colorata]